MLGKLLTPFTTATSAGVAVRDITIVVGAILGVLGVLGWLSPEQVEAIKRQVDVLTDPKLLAAVGTLMAAGMSIYRILTKSSSDKAAAAAKRIDQEIAPESQVVIKTPADQPDIVVEPK